MKSTLSGGELKHLVFKSFSFQNGDKGLGICRVRILEEVSFGFIWRGMLYWMFRVFGYDLDQKGYFDNPSVGLYGKFVLHLGYLMASMN